MTEFSGFMSDILHKLVEAIETDHREFKSVRVAHEFKDKLRYPAVNIIPDRVDYIGEADYHLYVIVDFYFEHRRDQEYLPNIELFEDSVQTLLEYSAQLSSVGEYKPVDFDFFTGAMDGSIIRGIQVTLRFSKLIDYSNIRRR